MKMGENRAKTLVKPQPKPAPWWRPFVTFAGIICLIYYIDNLYVNFFVFWFLIILNFGISGEAITWYIILFPTYIFAAYAMIGQSAFLIINGFFCVLFIVKSITGILKALGAGIPEKVESAHPTPPSGHIVEEMVSDAGKLSSDFLYNPKKTGLIDMPVKRKGASAIDHMIKKFRELMNH